MYKIYHILVNSQIYVVSVFIYIYKTLVKADHSEAVANLHIFQFFIVQMYTATDF